MIMVQKLEIYFTKANDYEEDVYNNFKLNDYLRLVLEYK